MHQQVMATKSLLYMVNAVRLSVKDLTLLIEKPTIAHFMWTAIQITRTYTHIRRLIRLATAEQQTLATQAVATRAIIEGAQVGAPTRLAQTTFGPGGQLMVSRGILSTIYGAAAAHPMAAAALVGATVAGGVVYYTWYQQKKAKEAWRERQREMRRLQGLEPP